MDGVLDRPGPGAEELLAAGLPAPPRGPVVVGYDGSGPARQAVHWAARRTARTGEPLVVVTAGGSLETSVGRVRARELADEGAAVARRTRAVPAGGSAGAAALRPVGVVGPGRASDVLVLAAQRAALLVVGSRGVGALPSAPLGAVSTAVAARARCPVVIVHGRDERDGWQERGPAPDRGAAHVVVAVDGTPASDEAVALAADEAAAAGAPLLVVAVWGAQDQTTWAAAAAAGAASDTSALALAQAAAFRHARDGARAAAQRYPDLRIHERVVVGPAVGALVEAAGDATLLVLGSRGLTRRMDVVRESVSAVVARRVSCPVVVVKAPSTPLAG